MFAGLRCCPLQAILSANFVSEIGFAILRATLTVKELDQRVCFRFALFCHYV